MSSVLNSISIFFIGVTLLISRIQIEKRFMKMEEKQKELEKEINCLRSRSTRNSNVSLENRDLIRQLAGQLDKKVEEVHVAFERDYPWNETYEPLGYTIIDLSEPEKAARKLREQADELESAKEETK